MCAAVPAEHTSFLVDTILPAKEIHLIFGPIAEENTLFALHFLAEWSVGHTWLGYATHPAPYCYVACEQSVESIRSAMAQVGLDPATTPHLSLVGRTVDEDRTVGAAIRLARACVPNLRVLFLDGMYSLCPGRINDYRDSSRFLLTTLRTCTEESLTIIGCVPTSKSREGEGYTTPREKIAGSGSWGAISFTKFLFEPRRPSKVRDMTRLLTVMPRSKHTNELSYTRTEHGLIYGAEGISNPELDGWLDTVPIGEEIPASTLVEAATRFGISRASLYRWLEERLELGFLCKLRHGVYVKPPAADPS